MKPGVAAPKTLIAGTLAFALGLIGLVPLFSDSPSRWVGVLEVVVIFFLSGVLIGYIHPSRWWMAGLTVWGGVFLTISAFFIPHRFANAPTVSILVADGAMRISPSVAPRGKLRLEVRNGGLTPHEIGLLALRPGASIEQLRQGGFQRSDLLTSLPRVGPGDSKVLYFAEDFLPPGTYAILCLLQTRADVPHVAHGELALFRVE